MTKDVEYAAQARLEKLWLPSHVASAGMNVTGDLETQDNMSSCLFAIIAIMVPASPAPAEHRKLE